MVLVLQNIGLRTHYQTTLFSTWTSPVARHHSLQGLAKHYSLQDITRESLHRVLRRGPLGRSYTGSTGRRGPQIQRHLLRQKIVNVARAREIYPCCRSGQGTCARRSTAQWAALESGVAIALQRRTRFFSVSALKAVPLC